MIRRTATLLFVLAFFAGPTLLANPARAAEMAQVPSPNGTMITEIYKPVGKGPFPVVVFSHGRSGEASERASLSHPVNPVAVSYWTARGYAVVAPIRPGYGATGGADREENYSSHCTRHADFANTASGAATAIVAAVDWVRQQPWAKSDRIILVGQSVGGLGTVAAAARHPAGVVAFVNFAGGSGGFPTEWPGKSCQPEVLTSLYGQFGASTSLPGIWFYAANDEYWGADAPKEWARAYRAGNPRMTAVFTGPTPNGKGHSLGSSAPQLWKPALEQFLKGRGL
ncbi:MAG: alpha/beta fold hydrolase [Devosia sp.]|nr:alpha/beta fold hydrolase [Devosia sp.]